VSFGRHIADADASPGGGFTPLGTASREHFDGEAGFDLGGAIFTGDFYDDDMHVRLAPRTLDAYLAPNGNANNRWRALLRHRHRGAVRQGWPPWRLRLHGGRIRSPAAGAVRRRPGAQVRRRGLGRRLPSASTAPTSQASSRSPSHGCVRVPNRVILRLARLMPVGTPIHIL
jgi:hypothetical protein